MISNTSWQTNGIEKENSAGFLYGLNFAIQTTKMD